MDLEYIKRFAVDAHKNVNHNYDWHGYDYHLQMVVNEVIIFTDSFKQIDKEICIAAAWLHDTIEDCRLTYNNVKNIAGSDVAEIVYALTNEKGKNRKERANNKYYEGIRNTKFARLIKICDRIANVTHSRNEGSVMFEMYKKENPHFLIKIGVKNGDLSIAEYEAILKLSSLFLN